jgi:pimeloyl-ACP methyl ester carboxylesterase
LSALSVSAGRASRARSRARLLLGAGDFARTNPALRPTFERVVGEDLQDAMRRVRVPTTLIWGARDRATPLADGRRMASLIPTATFHEIPGAGHYPFVDAPQAFSSIFAAALRGAGVTEDRP